MILQGKLRSKLAPSCSPDESLVSDGPSQHFVNQCRKLHRMEQMSHPYLHICFMARAALVRGIKADRWGNRVGNIPLSGPVRVAKRARRITRQCLCLCLYLRTRKVMRCRGGIHELHATWSLSSLQLSINKGSKLMSVIVCLKYVADLAQTQTTLTSHVVFSIS